MVKKAGAKTPLKTRILEMADDLNQFFARDIGTIRAFDHCQRLIRTRDVEGLRTIRVDEAEADYCGPLVPIVVAFDARVGFGRS